MPRTARLDIPGQVYHVTARGVEKREIFKDDRDRERFCEKLSELLCETSSVCLAWALLPNHLHLLLRPGPQGLASFMRRLLTGHAIYFNHRHDRAGHLFQNRYHSTLCDTDGYLCTLLRYIHLNPVRAGMVTTLDQLGIFPWSGHAVLMGQQILAGQADELVLGLFGSTKRLARRSYRKFIGDGMNLMDSDCEQTSHIAPVGRGGTTLTPDLPPHQGLGISPIIEPQQDSTSAQPPQLLSLAELSLRVCATFNLTCEDLESRGKTRHISDARALFGYLAVQHMRQSAASVAQHLGQNRSSITRAVRRGKNLLENRPELLTLLTGK